MNSLLPLGLTLAFVASLPLVLAQAPKASAPIEQTDLPAISSAAHVLLLRANPA